MTITSRAAMRCLRWRRAGTTSSTSGNGSVLRLESMCGGGGMGIAVILEPLS